VGERLAGFSRQAEGAFVSFVPYRQQHLNDALKLPWTGFHLVTISGKFGAVKTNLGKDDLAAIGAFYKDGLVGVIPVEGIEPRGPSAEVYELSDSQNELAEDLEDEFLYRLAKVDGGYVFNPEGPITVPGIRGAFHSHRQYRILRPDKVIEVSVGLKEYPPFPCGSDKTHQLSKEKMREVLERWERGGRQAIGAVVELADHGSHLFFFWTVNEKGVIPENPAEQMKEVFEKRYILPIFEVEQR
jgi:hypothetical protein